MVCEILKVSLLIKFANSGGVNVIGVVWISLNNLVSKQFI
jgi:hypothetical protein